MVASCLILPVTGKRGNLQWGSAGLDPNRKTACGPLSGGCITPFKDADPREVLAFVSQKLAKPLPTKDDGTLRTIREAAIT
jgi:hypothetical protein